jgi:GntR family transcriptional regulator, transcriptional repressor for pyruvate dehydrogenase complex
MAKHKHAPVRNFRDVGKPTAADKEAGTNASNTYLLAADQLRAKILDGDLKQGDRLPREIDLARQLGVARTTLREALRLLASERLIETRRGGQGGAFVTYPNSKDLDSAIMTSIRLMTMSGEITNDELMDASAALQPTITRLAIERATDEQAAELVALGTALAKAGSDAEWVEAGRTFNYFLAHLSGNRLLGVYVRPLLHLIPERYQEGRLKRGWRKRAGDSFKKLAEAIRDRSPAAATRALATMRKAYDPVLHPRRERKGQTIRKQRTDL